VTLHHKHAIVTGGARGIGLAIASQLAREGARVSIVSRSAVTAAIPSDDFFCAQADVTDEVQVRSAFQLCRDANGAIEILINNAGIAESSPLARTSIEMWNRIIAVNLTGTFLCTREVIPEMFALKWGRIVNVASTAGLYGAPYISGYCASKHGVVGFTRAVAAELVSSGVTVNAVCPGYTATEMMERSIANIVAKTGRSEAQTRELMAKANPEGRIATVHEVAQAVVNLIEGSQTGAAVVVPAGTIA
jgi:NAD(P)-dependent dehydrogenase (short-subunit alcohol dehydrogenase family)